MMEQIVREQIYVQPKKPAPPLKGSLLSFIVSIMLIGFAVANVGVRTLTQSALMSPDIFRDYSDIFPGQPQSAVEARAFLCQNDYTHNDNSTEEYSETFCIFTSTTDIFSKINVFASKGIITQITFLVRDEQLRFGDIETLPEVMDVYTKPNWMVFSWRGYTGLASAGINKRLFSLFCPVWKITFIASQ